MTGTARRVQAVRGSLARLVVVLAVLGGLGLAVGLQCTDGMAARMVMPMTHGANVAGAAGVCGSAATVASDHRQRVMSADAGQLTAECPPRGVAESFVFVADDLPNPGGLLATCLVFLFAVVAAVATLRPGPFRGVVRMFRPARVLVIRATRPRALSLAELCLLRT
jgi:hypothetical protein